MNREPNVSELCRMIRDSVGSALHTAANSPEVHEIKQTVREVVDELTGQLRDELGKPPKPPKAPTAPPPTVHATRVNVRAGHRQNADQPEGEAIVYGQAIPQRQLGKMRLKGNVMAFFGVLGATIGGAGAVLTLSIAIGALFSVIPLAVGFAGGIFFLAALCAFASLAFGALARRGLMLYGIAERYPKYLKIIGSGRFCAIKLLAESIGKRAGFVVKDLQKMIQHGMLPEAKLDAKKSCIILDDETYRQYLLAEERMKESRKKKQPEPTVRQETEQEEAQKPVEKTELERSLEEGRAYIERMREANRKIAGEQMSKKIDRLEQVSLKIFEHVELHPEKLPDIRRFMSYYLPITLKLLEAYCRFDAQEVQGENLSTAKAEINETLDTIVLAFENLLDSLFQMEVFDLSTDISALEAMLAQEGLTGSDFKKEGK